MKTRLFLVLCIILLHTFVQAQVKIGNNPTTINSASLLELEATDKGLVLPRVFISDVSSSLPLAGGLLTGTVVYNTNIGTTGGSGTGIYYWDGTKWLFISTGSAVSSTAWLLTGNSGLSSSINFIGTRDAVDFVAKTNNTERMRILGANNGGSKAGWIGMGVTVPRSSLDVAGDYTNKNVFTIQNTSNTGFSSVDMLDDAGALKGTFGYANIGTGGNFGGKTYFNTYGADFLLTSNSGTSHFFMKGGTGYIGINTSTPSERLHVVGNIYLNGAFMPGGSAGTSGYILTSAGAGVSPTWNNLNSLSWSLTGNTGTNSAMNFLGTTDNHPLKFKVNNSLAGYIDSSGGFGNTFFGNGAGNSNTTGYANTFIGAGADSLNTTGYNNTTIGYQAGSSNTTGYNNTATGTQSLYYNTTGRSNSAYGYQSLFNNTTGVGNTAAGYFSLYSNTTGQYNSAFGLSSLRGNTTGSYNVAVGQSALQNNTTGANNAVIGEDGMLSNTTGRYLAGIGTNVLYSNTTGSYNSAVGESTLFTNTTGAYNIAMGSYTLFNNTTANNNIAFGYYAGNLTTTGGNNIFIGTQSGSTNTTGTNNTLIGTNSSVLSTALTNAGALGYNAKVGSNNSLVLGDTTSGGNAVNVGIGVRYPLKRLHIDAAPVASAGVKDSLKIDNLAGSVSSFRKSVLVIDSTTGYVSRQSLAALAAGNYWSLTGNSGTNYATNFLGTTDNVSMRFRTNNVQRMIIDSLGRVGIGLSNPSCALSVLSASNPLYLSGVQNTSTFTADSILTINAGVVKKTPYSSLPGDFWSLNGNSGTNSSNFLGTVDGVNLQFKVNNELSGLIDFSNSVTTFGYQAGLNNGGVFGTTAFGWQALTKNVKGQNNTAVGNNSMSSNLSGASNTAIGYNTLSNNDGGDNNTALGNESLLNNTASDNTAGGYLSLNSNIFGQGNTAFGVGTLITNTKGDYNTAIGFNADVLKDGFTNATAIGYNAKAGASNTVILGSDKTDVGIGTSAPSRKLEVAGSSSTIRLGGVAVGGAFNSASTATTSNLLYTDNSTGDMYALPTVNNGILITNTSGVPSWSATALSSKAWLLTGNSGTSYATNFLGTTDKVSLRFRTNNIERMIIDSLGSVGIGTSTFNSINKEKLLVDYGTTTSHTIAGFAGSIDDYFQLNLQNKSNGVNASTDYVATADDGTDSTNYIDMGINSSTYAPGVENFGGPHDGYLYTYSRNLLIGTLKLNSDVIFLSGGGQLKNNTILRLIGSNNNVVVGRGEGTNLPIGNILRGPNASGTNIGGGSLTLAGGSATGTGTGGSINISGGTSVSGAGGSIVFNTSGLERIRVDASGNVGINNASASEKLDVTGNIRFSGALMPNNLAGTSGYLLGSSGAGVAPVWLNPSDIAGTYGWALGGNALSSQQNFGTLNNYPIPFYTNGIERMRITNTGLVGIGTTNPASDLTIFQSAGSGSSKGFTFTGNSIGGTNSGTGFLMSLGYNTSGNKQLWLGDGDYAGNASGSFARFVVTGAVFPVFDAVSGNGATRRYLAFGVAGDANSGVIFGGDATNVSPGSQVWDNGNMTIGSGYKSYAAPSNGLLVQGNVGIGTASPSSALSVIATSNPLYLSGVQPTSTFSSDSILTINGGVVKKTPYSSLPSGGGGSGWSLTGNTIAAGNFLGTLNALPLILKANNVQMGYFDGNVSSLALGVGAINNSSDHNVAIGYNALTNNQYALALGYSATATGVRSIAIGNGASATTASGAESISIGYNAISSSNQTIALGYQATASGSFGVAIGYGSLASALQSTAIGYSSLASAQYSNAIGYQANATGLQSTAIGYHAQTSQSNTVLLGDVSTPGLYVGIGTASPSAKLDIVAAAGFNPLKLTGLPTGSLNDNLLTVSGTGVVGSVPASTANSTYWNLNGNTATATSFLGTINAQPLQFKYNSTLAGYIDANNTSLGTSSSTTGTFNTAIGYSSSALNSATSIGASSIANAVNNTAVGNNATANLSSQETAIGSTATANAQYNTAIGYNAQAISNSQATAIGSSAAANGVQATALGFKAQAVSNAQTTALGASAQANGQYNTAVGYNAQAISNSQATAIGSSSLANLTNNTAVGYNAQAITGNLATAIGASAQASASNSTAIGASASAVTSAQTTAIGASSQANLTNNTALGYNAQAISNSQATAIGANSKATGFNSTAIGYNAQTAQANALILGDATATVNVGIGTSTPNTTAKLDVAGSFKLGTAGSVLGSVIKSSVTVSPTVNVGTTSTYTATVTGANTGGTVIVNPRNALANGVVIAYSYVSGANTVTIAFTSGYTSGALGALTFDVTVIQ